MNDHQHAEYRTAHPGRDGNILDVQQYAKLERGTNLRRPFSCPPQATLCPDCERLRGVVMDSAAYPDQGERFAHS